LKDEEVANPIEGEFYPASPTQQHPNMSHQGGMLRSNV